MKKSEKAALKRLYQLMLDKEEASRRIIKHQDASSAAEMRAEAFTEDHFRSIRKASRCWLGGSAIKHYVDAMESFESSVAQWKVYALEMEKHEAAMADIARLEKEIRKLVG